VDADGVVLDILVQGRRNQGAAEAFLRRLVAAYPAEPRVVVTDMLVSYAPAIAAVLPRAEHRARKGINNVAEHFRQPTRQRERAMRGYTSPALAERFLDPFRPIRGHVCPGRIACREAITAPSWPHVSRSGEAWWVWSPSGGE